MKLRFSHFLLSVVVCSFIHLDNSSAQGEKEIVSPIKSINVFNAPDGQPLGTLSRGNWVEILEKSADGRWLKVSLANTHVQEEGWIRTYDETGQYQINIQRMPEPLPDIDFESDSLNWQESLTTDDSIAATIPLDTDTPRSFPTLPLRFYLFFIVGIACLLCAIFFFPKFRIYGRDFVNDDAGMQINTVLKNIVQTTRKRRLQFLQNEILTLLSIVFIAYILFQAILLRGGNEEFFSEWFYVSVFIILILITYLYFEYRLETLRLQVALEGKLEDVFGWNQKLKTYVQCRKNGDTQGCFSLLEEKLKAQIKDDLNNNQDKIEKFYESLQLYKESRRKKVEKIISAVLAACLFYVLTMYSCAPGLAGFHTNSEGQSLEEIAQQLDEENPARSEIEGLCNSANQDQSVSPNELAQQQYAIRQQMSDVPDSLQHSLALALARNLQEQAQSSENPEQYTQEFNRSLEEQAGQISAEPLQDLRDFREQLDELDENTESISEFIERLEFGEMIQPEDLAQMSYQAQLQTINVNLPSGVRNQAQQALEEIQQEEADRSGYPEQYNREFAEERQNLQQERRNTIQQELQQLSEQLERSEAGRSESLRELEFDLRNHESISPENLARMSNGARQETPESMREQVDQAMQEALSHQANASNDPQEYLQRFEEESQQQDQNNPALQNNGRQLEQLARQLEQISPTGDNPARDLQQQLQHRDGMPAQDLAELANEIDSAMQNAPESARNQANELLNEIAGQLAQGSGQPANYMQNFQQTRDDLRSNEQREPGTGQEGGSGYGPGTGSGNEPYWQQAPLLVEQRSATGDENDGDGEEDDDGSSGRGEGDRSGQPRLKIRGVRVNPRHEVLELDQRKLPPSAVMEALRKKITRKSEDGRNR